MEVDPGDIGVTVRNGTKWMEPPIGAKIDLCECSDGGFHSVVGTGEITDRWYGPFRDVPARFLEFEHEIASRLYSGLFGSMLRAYGRGFTEYNEVTILEYARIS